MHDCHTFSHFEHSMRCVIRASFLVSSSSPVVKGTKQESSSAAFRTAVRSGTCMLSLMFAHVHIWQHIQCLIYQVVITSAATALRWLGGAPAVPKVFRSPLSKPHTTPKRPMRRLMRRLQATERPFIRIATAAITLLLVVGTTIPRFRSRAAGAVASMLLPRPAGCVAGDNGPLPAACSGEQA